MKKTVVATALRNGQMDGVGNSGRVSGCASSAVVVSTSRAVAVSPDTQRGSRAGAQSGSCAWTTGSASKLWGGGGLGTLHSSEPPPHGSAPARDPRLLLCTTL